MFGDVSGCPGWAWFVVLQGPSPRDGGRALPLQIQAEASGYRTTEKLSWSKDLPRNQNCTK